MVMAENRTYMCSGDSEVDEPRVSKRSRGAVSYENDRISSLPDSLLVHILSFLDTKEAVGTCLLSKRWEFVWTDLSEVDLNGSNLDTAKKRRRFVDWVGRMFLMCKNLNKIHVCCLYEKRSNVNNWVYFAMKSKVKDISLSSHEYELPQIFYSYSSLTNLTLSSCVIAPRRIIAWGSLKSLCLKELELSDSVMDKILAGCPLLNSLHLVKCWGLEFLNIYSPNLTTLVLSNYCSDWEGVVVPAISAPHLHFLSISDVDKIQSIRLSNLSSVVQANLDGFHGDDGSDMHQMLHNLKSLQSVESLELGRQCFMMVSLLEDKGYKLPLFTQLKCVTLVMWRHESSIPGILGLLRSSPKLETLHIKGCWETEGTYDEISPELDTYNISLKKCNMDLIASHLKTVKITDFSEEDLAAEYMLTLVETLLKSAKVLKKMVISVKDPSSGSAKDSVKIAKRLLTFLRASPEATVVFC